MECPLTVTGISTEDEHRMRHTSLVSCTVVMQRQVLVIQRVQKTLEVSQNQCLDPVVDVQVVWITDAEPSGFHDNSFITKCDADICEDLFTDVVLSGGKSFLDGNIITVGAKRLRCVEVLFQPSLIYQCDVEFRKDLYANVVFPGGTAIFQGIGEHRNPTSLQTETSPLSSSNASDQREGCSS